MAWAVLAVGVDDVGGDGGVLGVVNRPSPVLEVFHVVGNLWHAGAHARVCGSMHACTVDTCFGAGSLVPDGYGHVIMHIDTPGV